MSLFDKMKASIGIGNAKVDARLDKNTYTAGEEVQGEVFILGGKVEQEINGIYIQLMTEVERESDDKKYISHETIYRLKVSNGFTIHKGEEKTIPFNFTLPLQTPITIGSQDVWIKTELDVSFAFDPKDKDMITIRPTVSVDNILRAMDGMGFRLRKSVCVPYRASSIGMAQEFEFVPTTEFRGNLDEIEMIFLQEQGSVTLLMEVDRKAKGLGGFLSAALEMDETKLRLTFSQSDLTDVEMIKSKLRSVINQYS